MTTASAWRAAHPERAREQASKQNHAPERRRYNRRWEKSRQQRLNAASREQADRAHRKYAADEDAVVLGGESAREIAARLGRSIVSVENRRRRLKQEGTR